MSFPDPTARLVSYKDASAEALLMAMEKDNNVFLIGEGVDNITGVYGNTLPAFKKFGSSRIIDTPLCENGLTGFAIGAALAGMRPVLMHQRDDFMLLTMDQIVNQAVKIRYMSGGQQRVPLTVLSFIARKSGEGCQHSQSLQSTFSHFPGIKVGMPATPADVKGMLLRAIFSNDPTIILEHRELFNEVGHVPENYYETPFSSQIISIGNDATVVTVSATILDAAKARTKLLENYDISMEIIDLRWMRPIDISTILRSVRKTGRLLVVDTGWRSCSISSEIIALVCEKALGK
jgi:pyruvate/2-oxoglutarate/acetoin dehydrogenase E1 component